MNTTTKAYREKAILNYGFAQGMVLSIVLLIMIIGLTGCQTTLAQTSSSQTTSTTMPNETTAGVSDADTTSDNTENFTLEASDSVYMLSDMDDVDLIFTEGLGYQISWPLEERFIISPPENLRKLMLKTCQDTGYITPYINTIEFKNDGIKAYFLCRGFGG